MVKMKLMDLMAALNREGAVTFARNRRLIRSEAPFCPECDTPMTEVKMDNVDGVKFRCRLHKGKKKSIRDGSFFLALSTSGHTKRRHIT